MWRVGGWAQSVFWGWHGLADRRGGAIFDSGLAQPPPVPPSPSSSAIQNWATRDGDFHLLCSLAPFG